MLSNGPSVQNGLLTALNGQVVGWSFFNSAHLREFRGSIPVNKVSQSRPFARGGGGGLAWWLPWLVDKKSWRGTRQAVAVSSLLIEGAVQLFILSTLLQQQQQLSASGAVVLKWHPPHSHCVELAYRIPDEWHWRLYRSWRVIIEAAIMRNVPFKSQKASRWRYHYASCSQPYTLW